MNLGCLPMLAALLAAAPQADKAAGIGTGVITRPVPRTTVGVKPFTATGIQYWEPDRGATVASLFRSRLADTGRFAVVDSLVPDRGEAADASYGVSPRDRYILRGEVLKMGTRNALVVSVVEPGPGGETVRSWREEFYNLELIDRAVRKLVDRMAAEFPLGHVVVRVEGSEVDVELGSIDGLAEGRQLTVYQKLGEIPHPATGARIEWRLLPVGTIEIVRLGRRLSRARIVSENYVGVIQPGNWIE